MNYISFSLTLLIPEENKHIIMLIKTELRHATIEKANMWWNEG